MRRGEIRRVRSWNYLGHEATGNRPCLIISPDWFNSNGNVIIAPLTTPGPNHEHWWEIHIRSTDSTCLGSVDICICNRCAGPFHVIPSAGKH